MSGNAVTNSGPKIDKSAAEVAAFNPSGFKWDDAIENAHVVSGFDLAKNELADALVGTPFLITRLVFREGLGVAKCMVSVEMIIADEPTLRRRRVDMSQLPWEPGTQVVFNDGSTGVYRQLIAYLAAAGIITLPESDKPEAGSAGESRYDIRPDQFASIHAGDYESDPDGFLSYSVNVRLVCPRGLRLSTYEWEKGQDAATRYLG